MRRSVELYTDTTGDHRWRLRSGNTQITCGPQEGYRRPGERTRAMARDLGGIFNPDRDRTLPGGPTAEHPDDRRVGVLVRMEPNTDPHSVPGTFVEVEIPVIQVQS